MATKAEWVTTLKEQNPSLQKMVDGVNVAFYLILKKLDLFIFELK